MLFVVSRWEVNDFSLNKSSNYFCICLEFFIIKPWEKSTWLLPLPERVLPTAITRRTGTFDCFTFSTWCSVHSRWFINTCWMNKSCHFGNAKHWTKAFAYIISFNLPLKPVSIGIITSVLQVRKRCPERWCENPKSHSEHMEELGPNPHPSDTAACAVNYFTILPAFY